MTVEAGLSEPKADAGVPEWAPSPPGVEPARATSSSRGMKRKYPRVPIRGDCAHCGGNNLTAQEEFDAKKEARNQRAALRVKRQAGRRTLGFAGGGDAPKRK